MRCRLGQTVLRTGSSTLVSTNDWEMSDVFFEELGIPKPDDHLEAGGGSHAPLTAKIVVAFEEICQKARPDCVLVVGDVNSTLACSIVAKKQVIPVAHVEAGLRSGDMRMPEEINRLVTDSISELVLLYRTVGVSRICSARVKGRMSSSMFGHVMVDNLLYQRDKLAASETSGMGTEAIKAKYPKYGVVTPATARLMWTMEQTLCGDCGSATPDRRETSFGLSGASADARQPLKSSGWTWGRTYS